MTHALVDEFFLIKDDTGTYQGQVVEDLSGGYYLCQFYSWLLGEPTTRKIGHISAMLSWEFYSDADAWREAGKRATV